MSGLPDPIQREYVLLEPAVTWKAKCAGCGHDLFDGDEYGSMGPGADDCFDYVIESRDGEYYAQCGKCRAYLCQSGRDLVADDEED